MALLVFALMIGAMYLLIILPQQRKVKEHQALVRAVVAGDEIMTSSGLYGRIVAIDEDDVLLLEVAPGVQIRMARGAVAKKLNPTEQASPVDDDDPGSGSGPIVDER